MKSKRYWKRKLENYEAQDCVSPFLTRQRDENRKLLEEAKADIVADCESPENYKLYVSRRHTRPVVIKKKRYKTTQQTQYGEEAAQRQPEEDQLPQLQ